MLSYEPIINNLPLTYDAHLDVLRLDLIHDEVSGNKWFKLKYNLQEALQQNHKTIITFGGAFSNHIAATSAACKLFSLKSIAIIRGEHPQVLNPTLKKAREQGMHLHFVSREMYAKKETANFRSYLENTFGPHYLIPEGGNNKEGVIGSMEIIKSEWNYDYIICACGTGTTYAGLLASKNQRQHVVGVSVLKGINTLPQDVSNVLSAVFPKQEYKIAGNEIFDEQEIKDNCLINNYAFSGYAGYDKLLVDFKVEFERRYNITLDYVYTNKLMYAIFDLLNKKKFKKGAKILAVHSGGLQGNKGFEERYQLKPIR